MFFCYTTSMSWTRERKKFITFIVGAFFVLLGIVVVLPFVIKDATCIDGVKNGSETGTDCGGDCQLMCKADIIPLEIRWQRSVKVDEKTYDAVAYLVNKNNNAIPKLVSFKVTLSDKNRATIAEKEGSTVILPGAATPLYVPNIQVEGRIPVYTRFEIIDVSPFFVYSNQDFLKNVQVIGQPLFDNTTETPRLTLTIQNTLFDRVQDVDVYALLYDTEDTLIAVSKTYIESIAGRGQEKAYFSWRSPFSSPARFEFILVRDPFSK